MNTPVLLIVFNRMETAKRVFERIRLARPPKLFIAADGPRPGKEGEAEKCRRLRQWLVEQVDWDCELHTLFREQNLGCGIGPAEAITWFFNQVEQGIILEDDCLPALSFFSFAEQLLEKYKSDERVMQVSGTQLLDTKKITTDYFFSRFGTTWGWASWRRAWAKFDYDILAWKNETAKKKVLARFTSEMEREYYTNIFNRTFEKDNITWWDYQWMFARLVNKGLSILPVKNQVSNIGFGEHATHTFDARATEANTKTVELKFPLKHPVHIAENIDYDKKMLFPKLSILQRVKNRYRNLLVR